VTEQPPGSQNPPVPEQPEAPYVPRVPAPAAEPAGASAPLAAPVPAGASALAAAPAPAAASAPLPPPAPRRRGRTIVRVLGWTALASGVLALAGLSAYLWVTHEAWVDQNEELRAESAELGEQLAVARAEADAAEASLAETESQLDEATSTISTLANQDAHATEDLVFASDVIEQLIACADERAEHIGYLNQAWRYTTASLRAVEAEIDEFCAAVEETWTDYQDAQ